MDIEWLIGWKAIARHLGCCVRTAKTYYYEGHMPVRRPAGMRVRALKYTLDIWLETYSRLADKQR